MRRSLAEAIPLKYHCPFEQPLDCPFTSVFENRVVHHLAEEHTDEQAIEETQWDIKDYPPDTVT